MGLIWWCILGFFLMVDVEDVGFVFFLIVDLLSSPLVYLFAGGSLLRFLSCRYRIWLELDGFVYFVYRQISIKAGLEIDRVRMLKCSLLFLYFCITRLLSKG